MSEYLFDKAGQMPRVILKGIPLSVVRLQEQVISEAYTEALEDDEPKDVSAPMPTGSIFEATVFPDGTVIGRAPSVFQSRINEDYYEEMRKDGE